VAGERSRQFSLAVLAVFAAWVAVYWFWQPGGAGIPAELTSLDLGAEQAEPEVTPRPREIIIKQPETGQRDEPERSQPVEKPTPTQKPAQRPATEPTPQETREQPAQNDQPRVYTVQRGDSLSKIAQREYGSVRFTDLIYSANRDVLRSPDDLKVGMKLVLPPNDG